MVQRRTPGGRKAGGRQRTASRRRRRGPALPGYQFHKEKPGSGAKKATPKAKSKSKPKPKRTAAKKPKAALPTKAKPRRTTRRRRTTRQARTKLSSVLMALSASAIFVGLILIGLPVFLPDPPAQLMVHQSKPSISVLDRNGETIGIRGLTQGEAVVLEELPPYLAEAVLAVEDRRFYWHMGIDPVGLARAALINVQAGEIVQGGSTVTQQLAKNVFLKPDRTWKRKIDEAVYALWLEQKLSKDQILELYLNKVYLGAGTYGVEAAARRYFGKSARDVNLVEAALLAGLLKAPSRYAPTASMERASKRTGLVLDAMVDAGFISAEERQEAHAMPARIRPAAATPGADYLLDWVVAQVPNYTGPQTEDVIVTTTFDLNLQRSAELAVETNTAGAAGPGKKLEAAIVTLSPDGAIRAMVGGRAYGLSAFNRATMAKRPPGSAFKPFVYLAAMEAGWRPNHVLVDEPLARGDWHPANYGGNYQGPVTLETALATSINTIAIELGDRVGREKVIETARRFGILSPLEALPSLALGTQEVNLFELTSAYVPLASGGRSALPYSIISIRNKSDKLIYSRRVADEKQIAAPYSVGAVNYMLQSATERGTGKAARLPGRPIAGKTGTSANYRDAWFIGYTAQYVGGVWVGNDDFSPMNNMTGGKLPAKIWAEHMAAIHIGEPKLGLPYTDIVKPGIGLGDNGLIAAGAISNEIDLAGLPGAPSPEPISADQEPKTLFGRIAQALRRHSNVQ